MNSQDRWSGGELAGRVSLGLLFVVEACSKLGAYGAAASYMMAFGMPPQLLPATVAFELGAGILMIIGWYTRSAAIGLAVFCVVAAVVFHTKLNDRSQVTHFEKDLALAGAFLVVAANGAGRFSLEARLTRRRRGAKSEAPVLAPHSD
ncbi:MAG TPA: DoxX family protein [Dongiaceae bacterium]|jgi:putative oxidoreductase|nr:DoxX family protein [Dongiaceae bacterium]